MVIRHRQSKRVWSCPHRTWVMPPIPQVIAQVGHAPNTATATTHHHMCVSLTDAARDGGAGDRLASAMSQNLVRFRAGFDLVPEGQARP